MEALSLEDGRLRALRWWKNNGEEFAGKGPAEDSRDCCFDDGYPEA